jgi:hypothetical protein
MPADKPVSEYQKLNDSGLEKIVGGVSWIPDTPGGDAGFLVVSQQEYDEKYKFADKEERSAFAANFAGLTRGASVVRVVGDKMWRPTGNISD